MDCSQIGGVLVRYKPQVCNLNSLIAETCQCRPCELRRTASWGSRDAFSDGHIRRGQQQQDLSSLKGSSHTRTATTRGAALRRFHRSSMTAAVTRGSLDSAAPAEVGPPLLILCLPMVTYQEMRPCLNAGALCSACPVRQCQA